MATNVEKGEIVGFWCQITGFDIVSHTKEDKEKGPQKVSGPFQPVPIDPQLAAELRPFNGFYNLILMSSGPQLPISPNPGPIMPGPVFVRGFMMIDRSVEYSPNPVHKICISFKAGATFLLSSIEDITKQIIGQGGFDPATHEVSWSSDFIFHGSAIFTDLALNARSSFVTRALGTFADMVLSGGNQLAPAGLDVFVGNYEHVIGGAPPCTFNITKTNDGFQCTVKQLSGNQKEITASSISYNAQMYLLTVPDEPESGLRGFTTMLGTYSNVGLVAYVMGKNTDNSPTTGFIGINEKPDGHDNSEDDKLQNSALWSRMLMHSAEGAKKKAKKAEAATKLLPPTGVSVSPEIAHAMHPFNGFYSLTGSDLSDDAINWLCIDRRVTYYPLKSPQKGVPLYTVQVTYQLNGSSVQQISNEATQNFDQSTNTIKFGQTELKFSTQPLSKDQPTASQCEGQIQTSDGKIVRVSGTNSLTAPDISTYAGNYSYILKPPSKGSPFSLNLYFNQPTFEISITNEKTHKSAVVSRFTYDPQMFTINIPANPKADIPKIMVMLGTVVQLGCVAYITIQGKKPQESQISFISTNPLPL